MSLINQMLQDLEQRSVGNLAGGNMHNQIRAVPERKRVHPAWWLVLALSLALIGMGIWFWMRPVPVVPTTANLALKIDSGLNTLPSPVAQAPLPEVAVPTAPASSEPEPVAARKADDIAIEPALPKARTENAKDKARADDLRPEIATRHDGDAGRAKEVVKEAPQNGTARSNTGSTAQESVPQQALTKQVKELTSQQQAENEFRKAGVALQMGRQADAMTGLEQTLKLDPRHAAARQTLVGLLLQAKRNDDAIRLSQDGLALDPAQTGLSMILARVQVEQGDLHAALATLERGLPHAGARADYHAFMAALLQRDKRNKEAIEQYTIALGSTPQSGVWWMGLGISLQAENRTADAREAFSRAKATNTLTPELQAFVEQKLQQLH
jgi:MSHA biogenesis protein MshN